MNASICERPLKIAASIEISTKQVLQTPDLSELLPRGVRVYLPDIGSEPDESVVRAARCLSDLGYVAVPHIAVRRVVSLDSLERRVKSFTQEGGFSDVLLIAGDVRHPTGPLSSSLEALETEIFDRCGVRYTGVAGHPEGPTSFPEEGAFNALRLKAAFNNRSAAEMRIVSQYGFDAQKIIAWSGELEQRGVHLPVHVGVAGPAKLVTLIKYATTCGVGNSIECLRKRVSNVSGLIGMHSPESIVSPIEKYIQNFSDANMSQIHVFAFGGIRNTSEWLRKRKTWSTRAQDASGVQELRA